MDKLMVVLMSIKWLNKIERPLVPALSGFWFIDSTNVNLLTYKSIRLVEIALVETALQETTLAEIILAETTLTETSLVETTLPETTLGDPH